MDEKKEKLNIDEENKKQDLNDPKKIQGNYQCIEKRLLAVF